MDDAWISTVVGGIFLVIASSTGTKALDHIISRTNGKSEKRRNEIDRAWAVADKEAARRRRLEEHASELRKIIIEAPCLDANDLPDYPDTADKE